MTELTPAGRRLVWMGIVIVAVVCRIGASVAFEPDWEWSDAGTYDSIARNLLDGRGYSIDGQTPTRLRPPGYPLFLAAVYSVTGRNLHAVVSVQALLGAGTALLAGWLAGRVFGARAGYLAGVITAAYPGLIYYDTRILREGFTAFLIVATVSAAWKCRIGHWTRRGGVLATTGLMAAASLTRPETAVLLLPVSVIIAGLHPGRRHRMKTGLFMTVLLVVAWLPWTARNIAVFGDPSPVRDGIGSVMWFGNRWAEHGTDEQPNDARRDLRTTTQAMRREVIPSRWESVFLAETLGDLASRPVWFVEMVGRKAVLFWKDANGVTRSLPRIHPALPFLLNAYYYSLLAAGLAALALRYRESREVRALGLTVLVYFGTYALLHVRNRYRIPILPIVFVLSAGGLQILYDRAFAWTRRRRDAFRPDPDLVRAHSDDIRTAAREAAR